MLQPDPIPLPPANTPEPPEPSPTEEPTPMLDVHPAHHAANSWRDFFIHIATIVLGLCIAVGLEQTVEAIHHHHQREALLEDMREEARENVEVCQRLIRRNEDERAIGAAWSTLLSTAPVTAGKITITIPADLRRLEAASDSAYYTGGPLLPTMPVWTTAKETQTVGLLRPETARTFDSLFYLLNWIDYFARAINDAATAYRAALDVPVTYLHSELPKADTVTMTLEQRDAILKLRALRRAASEGLITQIIAFCRESQAVADGAQSDDDIRHWSQQHHP